MGAVAIRVVPADNGFTWQWIAPGGTVLWHGDGITYSTEKAANKAACKARKKFHGLQAEVDHCKF